MKRYIGSRLLKVVQTKNVKNIKVVEKIKEELSQQLSFSIPAQNTTESVETKKLVSAKMPKFLIINRMTPAGRMQKFLKMTPEEAKQKPKQKLKCEAALSELKKPVDTLRCTSCGVLFQRDVFILHKKLCKGQMAEKKFGCTLCSFTDYSYENLEEHVRSDHH